jgi:iron-sulfur cluster assembly 2
MTKDTNPALALRIQVESGGCHGFQYLMSLVTLPENESAGWSAVVGQEDSIFQYIPDDAGPETQTLEGPKVVIDHPSLELLKGSKVDFTTELIGSQFKIIDNPYATSSCGCGTSFDIKI